MNKKTTTAKAIAAQAANPETGEMQEIKYFPGTPKQYRFNGQNGIFNIDGIDDIGPTLSIHPIAWRVFKDELFGRPKIDDWAEIFFVDGEGCLSCVMFTNSSVTELMDLLPRLYYAGKKLSDVVLNISCEKKVTEKMVDGKKAKVSWALAKFNFEDAPAEAVAHLTKFAQENPIFRRDTITSKVVYRTFSDTYAIATAQLISGNQTRDVEDFGEVEQAA